MKVPCTAAVCCALAASAHAQVTPDLVWTDVTLDSVAFNAGTNLVDISVSFTITNEGTASIDMNGPTPGLPDTDNVALQTLLANTPGVDDLVFASGGGVFFSVDEPVIDPGESFIGSFTANTAQLADTTTLGEFTFLVLDITNTGFAGEFTGNNRYVLEIPGPATVSLALVSACAISRRRRA